MCASLENRTSQGGQRGRLLRTHGSEEDDLGKVKIWMERTERRDRKRYGMKPSREIARDVLKLGGWACWSTVVTVAVNAEDSTDFRLKVSQHRKMLEMCGRENRCPPK